MQARICDMFRKRAMDAFVVNVAEDVDGVRWARSCTGPVVNKDAPNLTCYGCDESLSFVKAHESSRNGIKHRVNSFYRHRPGVQTRTSCCSETIEHKAAKHALRVNGQKWRFFYPCGMCQNPIPIEVCDDERNTFDEEVAWKQYKLDIGIVREGNVFGAIEVLVTHASTADKLDKLTENDIAWCEVHAHRVLDALENNTFEVEVAKCAIQICDVCIQKEKTRVFQELDRELMRSAADEKMLQRKRQRIIQDARAQWQQMTPTESHDDQQQKWILLTQCIQKAVITKASELGLCTDQASAHADDVLDGELILKFGKHKGRTLSSIQEDDWPYLLWLAGYNFGSMDDRGKAERRCAGKGTNFITNEIEMEANKIVQGSCFNCQDEIFDYAKQPWRTWCKRCYAQLKYN